MSYTPTWKVHQKGISSDNLDTALKSTEAYEEEKALELKTSAKAREWEKSKKEYYQKQKPAWVKDKRLAQEAPLKQALEELKVGGKFDTGLQPMPNFVLVKPEFKETTDSGLLLLNDDAAKLNCNTGVVMAIGGERVDLYKAVQPPVKQGDRVMFKKGLPGLEMSVKGEYCLLMTWEDILGILE